ncbi:hypothetical protein LSAT2_032258, partial [Lamellibrachia satsuma]
QIRRLHDMALLNAEKQRCYRDQINTNPAKQEKTADKERLQWHERKRSGKVETINQMTNREQRKERKKWRENYQRYLLKKEEKKELKDQEENMLRNTPPTSPTAEAIPPPA